MITLASCGPQPPGSTCDDVGTAFDFLPAVLIAVMLVAAVVVVVLLVRGSRRNPWD